jgi:amino-acid N-acetyltransferase
VIIRGACSQDFEMATAWLVAAGLPTADLSDAQMEHFLVAVSDDTPIGMIGLEPFEDTGLLRSLVVDPSARSGGIGQQLVAALEAYAVSLGIETLWLLTIDADVYFAAHGYDVKDRNDSPDCIRNTIEFSKLCPGDAVLMRKILRA